MLSLFIQNWHISAPYLRQAVPLRNRAPCVSIHRHHSKQISGNARALFYDHKLFDARIYTPPSHRPRPATINRACSERSAGVIARAFLTASAFMRSLTSLFLYPVQRVAI